MRTALFASLALVALAAPALADVLTLHNGAQLDGKLVEQRADEVVFEHTVQGVHVRSIFAKADVAKLEVDYSTRAAPGGAAPVTSLRYPELRDLKKRVAIVVDRSGSMAIGDRYLTALDEVDKLLAELPPEIGVSAYAFDRKAIPLTEANFLKANDETRRKIRAKLDQLGVNREGYTDLVAGIAPAIAAEPDAIYLFSDGVPTLGEPSAQAVWRGIREKLNLLPPPKNVLIHTVGLTGGAYEYGCVENPDGARLILRTIAESTGAKYRELPAVDHSIPLALRPLKELAPPADPVTFRFYETDPAGVAMQKIESQQVPLFRPDKIFFLKEFVAMEFLVEVEDPALADGPLVLEYAALPHPPRIELEHYPPPSVSTELYDSKRDLMPLVPWIDRHDDLNNGAFQATTATATRGSTLRLYQRIHLVRGLDARKNGYHTEDSSDRYDAFLKVHPAGGTLDVIYRRGNKSWKHVFFLDPLMQGGAKFSPVTPSVGSVAEPKGTGSHVGGGHR
jgi:hypothetical protein